MTHRNLVRLYAVCFACGFALTQLAHGQAGDTDPTFYCQISGFLRGGARVYTFAEQADGRILVGGAFTNVNGTFRAGIGRLNPDGSLDSTFDPGSGADNLITSIICLPDDKTLVGGGFNTFNGGNGGLVRLNQNGSLDTNFISGAGLYGYSVAYHPSGKIYVASANHLRRVNFDGSRDTNFSITIDGGWFNQPSVIADLAIQPDGKLLFAGNFSYVNDQLRYASARLNVDGSVDSHFFSDARGFYFEIDALGLRAYGGIYQAGGKIALVTANGELDTNFTTGAGAFSTLYCIDVQSDDKPIVGGSVREIAGSNRDFLARFQTNGLLDETFGGHVNGSVHGVKLQRDRRILVGGSFSIVNGEPRSCIVRLLGDRPVLRTDRLHGGDVLASWPAAYTNWVLQGTKNEKFGDWEAVTNPVVTLNGINYVTNRIGGTGKFYRLVKP